MAHWTQQYIDEWLEATHDYPSRAMLLLACEVMQEQENRLEIMQGQLDGQLWQDKVVQDHSEDIY